MTERQASVRWALKGGDAFKRELKGLGDAGEAAMRRLRDAAKVPTPAIRAVEAGSRELSTQATNTTKRLGFFGAALRELGPAGIGAGIGLTSLIGIMTSGLRLYAKTEQDFIRLEAVLRATGAASGFTARELNDLASELQQATLFDADQVNEASAALLTFKNVQGPIFTRAIELSADLAATFNKGLTPSAIQVGKALDDPIKGVMALREVGVSFTVQQQGTIRSLVETGKLYEAQGLILDVLRGQVGGVAREMGSRGLAAAFDDVNDEVQEFSKHIVEANDLVWLITTTMRGWAIIIREVRFLLGASTPQEQLFRLVDDQKELLAEAGELEARAREARRQGQDTYAALLEADLARVREELDAVEGRQAELAEEERKRTESFVRERQAAERARLEAEKERLRQQEADAKAELERLTLPRSEQLRRDRDREIADLQSRRKSGNSREVDAAIAAVTKSYELQIEKALELEQRTTKLGDAQVRAAKAAAAAARRAAAREEELRARQRENNAEVIADLERELELLRIKDREARAIQRQIDGSTGRLQNATPEEVAHVEGMVRAIEEQKRAEAALLEIESRRATLLDSLRNSEEERQERLKDLIALYEQGAISAGKLAEEEAKIGKEREAERLQEYERALFSTNTAAAGLERGLYTLQRRYGDIGGQVQSLTETTFRTFEDSLVSILDGSTTSLKGLKNVAVDAFQSIVSEMVRFVVQAMIMKPIMDSLAASMGMPGMGGMGGGFGPVGGVIAGSNAAGGGGGGFFGSVAQTGLGSGLFAIASIFHKGGTVGDDAPFRLVPAAAFASAPRMHRGGLSDGLPSAGMMASRLGLRPDERAAILQTGERVLARGESMPKQVSQTFNFNLGRNVDPAKARRAVAAGLKTARQEEDRALQRVK